MSILTNRQLLSLLKDCPDIIAHTDVSPALGPESLIQPASCDLTVGRIFIPPSHTGVGQAAEEVDDFYKLKQGASALIVTREQLRLPANIAGIMFPKNGDFSQKGILITNFGHVDPGFSGHLQYTIINFGPDDFRVVRGQRIACLLLIKLSEAADPDWSAQTKHLVTSPRSHASVLNRDFLDIDRRISQLIETNVSRAVMRKDMVTSFWIPMATAVFALIGIVVTFFVYINDKLIDMNKAISQAEARIESRLESR